MLQSTVHEFPVGHGFFHEPQRHVDLSGFSAGSMPVVDYKQEGRNTAKTNTPVLEQMEANLSSKGLALSSANSRLFNRWVGTVGDHRTVQHNIRIITQDLVPFFHSQHKKKQLLFCRNPDHFFHFNCSFC